MKTKNAFAFRDFDSSRILQRPFFKNFYFDSDKSDAEILDSLSNTTKDSVDSWEKNLYAIKATYERLAEFRHLIDRHNENRLNRYNRKKSEAKGNEAKSRAIKNLKSLTVKSRKRKLYEILQKVGVTEYSIYDEKHALEEEVIIRAVRPLALAMGI